MDFSKLPPIQAKIVRKALNHLTEARDLFCCSNSPYGRVADQEKVLELFKEFVDKLKNIKP